jgi:hypothetical protein
MIIDVRRLPRILLNAATALSLVLFVATVVLWLRSYGGSDFIQRQTPGAVTEHSVSHRTIGMQWTLGQIRLTRGEHTAYLPPAYVPTAQPTAPWWSWGRLGEGHLGWQRAGGPSFWNRLGFCSYSFGSGASFYDASEEGITVPAWLLPLAFFIPPLTWSRRAWRGRRRRRAGECLNCGYDLRATPERCPECGTIRAQ